MRFTLFVFASGRCPLTHRRQVASLSLKNAQVRILRVMCPAGQKFPASEHPADPAIMVNMTGPHRGEVKWSPPATRGPVEQVRIELKTRPVK